MGTLVDELNDDVSEHLTRCFAHQQGVHIVTDANIRASSMPKGRIEYPADGPIVLSEGADASWDRGWGVYSHVGYLARVLLRVTASEPPVVHLFVNGDRIMSRVPDWIANRGKGTDDKQDHATFQRTVLQAVKDTIIAEDHDR